MEEIYNVEIVGLISIKATSKEDAISQVKDLFESGDLTYENLSFSCDDEEE